MGLVAKRVGCSVRIMCVKFNLVKSKFSSNRGWFAIFLEKLRVFP